MKTWTSFLIFTLLVPGIVLTCSNARYNPASEIELTGSTPAEAFIKSKLAIPASRQIDFIKWHLTLHGKTGTRPQNTFTLKLAFTEAPAGNSGATPAEENLTVTGEYAITQNNNDPGEIYRLKSPKLPSEITIIKLNDNIFQLLDAQNKLLVGNGGWSYTLNRKDPIRNISALPSFRNALTATSTTALQTVYTGRTPCQEIANDNNLPLRSDCFKLKWQLILNRDAQTKQPTTYVLKTTFNRQADIAGKWEIKKGLPSNPGAIIYQLYPDKQGKSFSLLAADDNILYLLNKKNELYVGNADFSFTLNRTPPPPAPQLLTLKEAEQILGEPALLIAKSDSTNQKATFFRSTFKAKETDARTNKLGQLFYSYEVYKNPEDAHNLIQTFIKSNQNQEGFELLKDLGDDAFLHTDKSNFITLVCTKNNKMIRLKVNKITTNTSLAELKKIAKNLVSKA